jgi:hypothetical protein
MLINLVGRTAVQTALSTTGMADPALNRPFLTREMFILKLDQWPALANRVHRREPSRPAGAARQHHRPGTPSRPGGGASVDHATRHQHPGMVPLGG